MNQIHNKYIQLCRTFSDIYEHLPTLSAYASQCESILELGVRGCVSSWAFVHGLLQNTGTDVDTDAKRQKRIFLNDIVECDISELVNVVTSLTESTSTSIEIGYEWKNDLELEFPEGTRFDLVFIDTWHVYGQLKRELAKFAPMTNKYILMHDTTVDGVEGETIRNHWDAESQSRDTEIPVSEIRKGLWPAVEEFLAENPEWSLVKRYENCNGLTILRRNT